MNSKYRMFKNFMFNDLGITKDDIKEWTKEAVKEVALDYVQKSISEYELPAMIRSNTEYAIRQAILKDNFLKEFLSNKIEIKIKSE